MILVKRFLHFAELGKSLDMAPISRLTVLRAPMASRCAIQSKGTVVPRFTARAMSTLRASPQGSASRSASRKRSNFMPFATSSPARAAECSRVSAAAA